MKPHPFLICLVLLGAAWLLLYRIADIPAGLHVDAAVEGLDAQQILHGQPAIFFPVNSGRGAAYVYFEAGLMALAGTSRLVYGFATVAMALLGVACSYRMLKLLFGVHVAVLAGALMAVSVWFVFISRIGVWPVMVPLATAAPLYFLWRVLRWGWRRDALLAGAALGLSQYCYYAIRFLPLLVLALCLASWPYTRKRLRLLLETAAVTMLVILPEGVYFVRHPEVALARPQAVSIFGSSLASSLQAAGQGLAGTAGMFFVKGDWRPWQNTPSRPVFDPLLGAIFCAGLLVALARSRDLRYRWLLLWLVVMSLPTALTSEPPSNFRAYGAAAAAFALPALALVAAWRACGGAGGVALLALPLLGFETSSTVDAYFRRWAPSPVAAVAFDAHDTRLAGFAVEHPDEAVYFSDIRTLAGQPVRALVPGAQEQGWYPENSAAIPLRRAGGGDMLYAGSPRSAIGGLAPEWLPDVQLLVQTGAGDPRGFWAFRWPAAARKRFLAAQRPFSATFGGDLRLVSYGLSTQAGGTALDLLWEQLQPSGPYDLYTHVLDSSGRQVAQDDKLYLPVERLGLAERFGQGEPTDDLILTRYSYQLAPGHYAVEIGAVHRSSADLGQLLAAAGPSARLEIDVS